MPSLHLTLGRHVKVEVKIIQAQRHARGPFEEVSRKARCPATTLDDICHDKDLPYLLYLEGSYAALMGLVGQAVSQKYCRPLLSCNQPYQARARAKSWLVESCDRDQLTTTKYHS